MDKNQLTQFGENTKIIWQDKKRWCGLPWSFTRYYIVEKEGSWLKLFTSVGFLSIRDEEVNVYRIFDITVHQSISNRMFGTGTLILHCQANNNDEVALVRVKDPYKVRALLQELIEKERAKRGTRINEFTLN